MIGFFTPRYVKEGKETLHGAHKMLAYKRDLLTPADLEAAEALIARLDQALRGRDPKDAEAASEEINRFFAKRFPLPSHPEIRENVEVFLVAIVIALGIRTFFLQPFTIPTGSMQPTLNGILVSATQTPPPNLIQRTWDLAVLGRSYFRVVPEVDDTVMEMRDVTRFRFFNYTELRCAKQTLLIPAPATGVAKTFGIQPGVRLQAGQAIQGYADTGDHVFVNKVAYNFRDPRRGEVFVFSTLGIPTDENRVHPDGPSQYYIKRLAGLPGDTLRIDPPQLFINGQLAKGRGFERVMSGTQLNPDGTYRGYANGPFLLTTPDSPFQLPVKRYFALGDNSYNSADSRYWGTVPQENLMGCGLFVYWPFTKHWGFIK
ncbi:MAG: signal peptidase I [Chthoniobacteraceae bacterium]|nr:signal peptidase I [Chthoniobacteraceae bacterium]